MALQLMIQLSNAGMAEEMQAAKDLEHVTQRQGELERAVGELQADSLNQRQAHRSGAKDLKDVTRQQGELECVVYELRADVLNQRRENQRLEDIVRNLLVDVQVLRSSVRDISWSGVRRQPNLLPQSNDESLPSKHDSWCWDSEDCGNMCTQPAEYDSPLL